MLQVPEGRRKSWSRLAQAAALCLLFGAALAVTALRHPATLGAEEQAAQANNTDVTARKTSLPEAKPFDLTYLPPNAQGVFVVRPEVLFARPDMKKIAKTLDRLLSRELKEFGLKCGLELPVSEIEQLLCPIYIELRKHAPDGKKGQLHFTIQAIRARKKFDWTKQIKKSFPELTEVTYQGKVYWKISESPPFLYVLGKCFYVPDDRTLVICTSEDQARSLIQAKSSSHKIPHWDKVKTQDLAVWFSLPQKVKKYLADMKTPDAELALLKHMDFLTVGCTFRNDFRWQGFSDFPDTKAVANAEKALREGLAESKREVDKLLKKSRGTPGEQFQEFFKISLDLLQPEIRRTGTTLQASGRAASPLALLLGAMLAENKIPLEE